jgi:outer membrane protein TolC
MQKNNLWPEINLEASVSRNGLNNHFSQAIQDISSEDNREYFLGLKIKFPLQNRQAKSEFNKAKIEQAKALLDLKRIERWILIEMKDGVRNCRILEQRASKQENVVRLQEEKLAAELKAYQYGRSDTDTVIRYQDDLLSSRLLYTQALFDYKQSLVELSLKENILLDHFWKDEL